MNHLSPEVQCTIPCVCALPYYGRPNDQLHVPCHKKSPACCSCTSTSSATTTASAWWPTQPGHSSGRPFTQVGCTPGVRGFKPPFQACSWQGGPLDNVPTPSQDHMTVYCKHPACPTPPAWLNQMCTQPLRVDPRLIHTRTHAFCLHLIC